MNRWAFQLALALVAIVAVHAFSSERTTRAMLSHKRAAHQRARAGGPPTGEFEYQLARPEGNRTFWAYVPSSYSQWQAHALVFAFHGLGDNCQRFGHETGMVAKAELEGFLLVYPCGTPGGFFGVETAWNAGTCCMEGSPIDDIAFSRAMVEFMSTNYNVDPTRVYVSGFSNGAFMTETLLCNSSDLFMAGASVSGAVVLIPGNSGGLDNCDRQHAAVRADRSLLHIHGNWDPVVPWNGDAILGFPPIPEDFSRWASRVHCQGAPVQTFSNGSYSNEVYKTCGPEGSSVTIELVKHDGGGHEWPSDQYFDTTSYIWQFFASQVH